MGNPFVHVELMATDVNNAKSFYGELFDWKLEDMNMGDMTYTIIKVGAPSGRPAGNGKRRLAGRMPASLDASASSKFRSTTCAARLTVLCE